MESTLASNSDGLQTLIHRHNDGNGTVTFEAKQDVGAILEDAKRRHLDGATGTSEMKHAARIPLIVVDKYCNDHGIEFREFIGNKAHVRAMCNDPALSGFRVWPGRV